MIEAFLRDFLSGSARLASGDARLNLALADAVERHATKDPETRGILKRSSVVCHRESEPRKQLLHTAGFDIHTLQGPTEDHQYHEDH